jgi:hypothetical protein
MPGRLTFGLLGPLEIQGPDGLVPLRAARQRVVLASLLLQANRPVPVDELIDRLWGDEPVATARATVHQYVMRVRQILPEQELIRTVPDDYLLREALSIWRGPALADVRSSSLQTTEIPRLTELRLQRARPSAGCSPTSSASNRVRNCENCTRRSLPEASSLLGSRCSSRSIGPAGLGKSALALRRRRLPRRSAVRRSARLQPGLETRAHCVVPESARRSLASPRF